MYTFILYKFYSINSISAPSFLNCSTKLGKRRNNGVTALSVLSPGAASAARSNPYAAWIISPQTRFAGCRSVGQKVIILCGSAITVRPFIFANSSTKNHAYSYPTFIKIADHSHDIAVTAKVWMISIGSMGQGWALTIRRSPLIVFSILRDCSAGTKIVSA